MSDQSLVPVLAVTADGGSPKRRLFQLPRSSRDQVVYKAVRGGARSYVDPQHLLKKQSVIVFKALPDL